MPEEIATTTKRRINWLIWIGSAYHPKIGGQVIASAAVQTITIMVMARRFDRRRLE